MASFFKVFLFVFSALFTMGMWQSYAVSIGSETSEILTQQTNDDLKINVVDNNVQNDKSFSDIDTDKDGQITKEQFSEAIDADTSADSFVEFDANEDGKLSENEYNTYLDADFNTDLTE